MTNDHLASVANQRDGVKILLEMVSAGHMTADDAMAEIESERKRRFGEMNLAQKLAHWFSRAMFYLAG